VPSLEEAAVLMDELQGLPEFLFGYMAPGAKPKVLVFLDAAIYGDKRPKGMVEMLIPAERLGSNDGLTGVTGGSSVKRLLDREGARRLKPVDPGNAIHPLGQDAPVGIGLPLISIKSTVMSNRVMSNRALVRDTNGAYRVRKERVSETEILEAAEEIVSLRFARVNP